MKQLTWKLVLPLTIISFATITKWWYVQVYDGSDEILTGFPLPYMCPGWHTSMSLQIFISELIIDILTYFTFWFFTILIINQFIKKIRLNKVLTIILLAVSGIMASIMILIASNSDNVFTFKREFKIEVLESGYQILWQGRIRPDNFEK